MKKSVGKTYVFIDASNLNYGGSKLLGWQIDYEKFLKYLKAKYKCNKVCFYSGIFTYNFRYSNNSSDNFPIDKLVKYLELKLKSTFREEWLIVSSYLKKAVFLKKLEEFGYDLKLKPIKSIRTQTGRRLKANCDIEICFEVMRNLNILNRIILVSGDGDFEIVIKYCLERKIQVVILSNPKNTAMQIKKLFSKNYKSIQEIRSSIERKQK